jgi:hypothetical protein
MDVHFYFDPLCPWTWMTSRWLLDVASQRKLNVVWHTFSLRLLNEGEEGGEEEEEEEFSPELLALGAQILHIVESLRDAGRNEDAGRFYTECGVRIHVRGTPPSRALLEDAATAAGIEEGWLDAGEDESWDSRLRASLDDALARAGPDIGSPVIVLDDNQRGTFGPIVSPPPEGGDAVRLWEAVVALHSLPTFLEIKRGRTGPPAVTAGP